jgi:hypothetical protein
MSENKNKKIPYAVGQDVFFCTKDGGDYWTRVIDPDQGLCLITEVIDDLCFWPGDLIELFHNDHGLWLSDVFYRQFDSISLVKFSSFHQYATLLKEFTLRGAECRLDRKGDSILGQMAVGQREAFDPVKVAEELGIAQK